MPIPSNRGLMQKSVSGLSLPRLKFLQFKRPQKSIFIYVPSDTKNPISVCQNQTDDRFVIPTVFNTINTIPSRLQSSGLPSLTEGQQFPFGL
jgi:hypothetical protein